MINKADCIYAPNTDTNLSLSLSVLMLHSNLNQLRVHLMSSIALNLQLLIPVIHQNFPREVIKYSKNARLVGITAYWCVSTPDPVAADWEQRLIRRCWQRHPQAAADHKRFTCCQEKKSRPR